MEGVAGALSCLLNQHFTAFVTGGLSIEKLGVEDDKRQQES